MTALTLGETLYLIRRRAKLSQSQVAKLARCSRNEISEIERGKANVRLSTLIAVCEALGYTTEINIMDKEETQK